MLDALRVRFPSETSASIAADLGLKVHIVSAKGRKLGLEKSAEYLASAASGRIQRGQRISTETEFQKGGVSHNRGRKGWSPAGTERTRFKKGNRPWNGPAPIGAHRVNSLGYLDRKISTDKRGGLNWEAVHRLVWKERHGPVPDGFLVAFKKGMRTTELEKITVDVLELVSRVDHGNRNNMWTRYPREVAHAIVLLGAIKRRIRKREESNGSQD